MTKEEDYNKLKQLYRDCSLCGLCESRTNVVFGRGNLDADIMVISEAPSEVEDSTGLIFNGEVGEIFKWILENSGIDKSRLWITSTVMCRPESKGGRNKTPKVSEIKGCKPRLIEEISLVSPKIIVLAGNVPLLMATGKRGITKNRGIQSYEGSYPGKMFATLHPASLLHGPREQKLMKANWLLDDWREIARILNAEEKSIEE